MKREGQKVRPDGTVSIAALIPAEEGAAFHTLCAANGTTAGEEIRRLVRAELAEQPDPDRKDPTR